jgi:hypothetical protein
VQCRAASRRDVNRIVGWPAHTVSAGRHGAASQATAAAADYQHSTPRRENSDMTVTSILIALASWTIVSLVAGLAIGAFLRHGSSADDPFAVDAHADALHLEMQHGPDAVRVSVPDARVRRQLQPAGMI